MRRVFIPLFLILYYTLPAQELKVQGKFVQDSVKVGEEAFYSLSAHYPSNLNVLFPDSTENFQPFEYFNRKYFATHTVDGISHDSVVYVLKTFATDSVQHLSLPVYVVHPSDCTIVTAGADSILLATLIKKLPDSVSLQSLQLKENLAFEPIPTVLNYVILSFVLGVLVVIGGVIWLLFGKKIQRHYLIKRLQKNHARFIQDFGENLTRLTTKPTIVIAESTTSLWKKYLENLEAKPYTKLTTREIANLVKSEEVKKSLHSIDRAIYGNNEVSPHPFSELKDFAEREFRKKLQEVMHE